MKKYIKEYREMRPDEKYRTKNALIAVAVLVVTSLVLAPMFVYTLNHDIRGNWPFAIQTFAIALGGLLVAAFFTMRYLRGKR